MPSSRQRIYWTCQVAGWLAVAAINLIYSLYGDTPVPAWKIVVGFTAGAVAAIGWTHGYRAVLRRWRWLTLGLPRLVPRALVAAIAIGTAISLTTIPVWLFLLGIHASPISAWLPVAIVAWSAGALAWSAVYLGMHYFERWREAEMDKLKLVIVAQDAQLHGLMAQLQPHFLFNCLNSVRALIVEDPARAQTTVTSLSRLLRHTLQAGKESTVPLAAEIEMVRIYLELEAVRFEERLRTDIDVAADAGGVHVPAMLVQSLVENGVKHGIERSPAGGTIGVAAWRDRGALRVRVTNPGRIGSGDDSTRIGLANARARLQLLYGDDASLALSDGDRTVVAEVSIPIRETAA